jgi:hypothetical protein
MSGKLAMIAGSTVLTNAARVHAPKNSWTKRKPIIWSWLTVSHEQEGRSYQLQLHIGFPPKRNSSPKRISEIEIYFAKIWANFTEMK